ncbi:substrate-binding domain-containing protein [Ketobacter alkanivorans]|nr:substrate-binding domain-containing protein [Ketobacter alkanivorans]
MVKYRYGNGSAFLFSVFLFVSMFSSWCWSQSVESPSPKLWKQALEKTSSTAAEIELFSIVGSNTVGEKLAPALVSGFLREQGFENIAIVANGAEHKQKVVARMRAGDRFVVIAVPVAAQGSSTGFKALKDRTADLAASSRPIKVDEQADLAFMGNMLGIDNEHIVAIDGLAIVIHPDNPITKLPLQTVNSIFTGKVSNWSQLGGRAGAINVHARDDRSGTFDTFQRLVLNKDNLTSKAKRYESNDDLSKAVQQDVNAIGFVALPSIGGTKALAVSDGVAKPLLPSDLTVATEDYPLSRRLYFYSSNPQGRKPVVSDFLAYVRGNAGQSIVAQTGYVAQALFAMAIEPEDGRLAGWQRMNLNIRFEDGSSTLDNKSELDVQRLAEYLSKSGNDKRKVTLVGFSNPVTGGASQSSISRLRAQNVRWALRNKNIRNKLSALAGSAVTVSDPDSLNADRNRRVEVWIQ